MKSGTCCHIEIAPNSSGCAGRQPAPVTPSDAACTVDSCPSCCCYCWLVGSYCWRIPCWHQLILCLELHKLDWGFKVFDWYWSSSPASIDFQLFYLVIRLYFLSVIDLQTINAGNLLAYWGRNQCLPAGCSANPSTPGSDPRTSSFQTLSHVSARSFLSTKGPSYWELGWFYRECWISLIAGIDYRNKRFVCSNCAMVSVFGPYCLVLEFCFLLNLNLERIPKQIFESCLFPLTSARADCPAHQDSKEKKRAATQSIIVLIFISSKFRSQCPMTWVDWSLFGFSCLLILFLRCDFVFLFDSFYFARGATLVARAVLSSGGAVQMAEMGGECWHFANCFTQHSRRYSTSWAALVVPGTKLICSLIRIPIWSYSEVDIVKFNFLFVKQYLLKTYIIL